MINKLKTKFEKVKNLNKKLNNINNNTEKLIKTQELLISKYNDLEQQLIEQKKINGLVNTELQNLKQIFNKTNVEIPLYLQSNKKPRLLIVGFYGAPNLGDELMLETLLKYIPNKFDITVMLCENYNYDITKYSNCSFIHYPKYNYDLNIIAQNYDILLFGGGALIDDSDYNYNEVQLSLGYILINLSLKFLNFNKKVFWYGLSCSDTFEKNEFKEKLELILQKIDCCALRDKNSLEVLKKYNYEIKNVEIVDDIVFANEDLLLENNHSGKDKKIGIIYVCDYKYYKDLLVFTKRILELTLLNEYTIEFIPFYDYNNNDINFYKKIKEELGSERIVISDYTEDIPKTIDKLLEQSFVISMRYHGTLLANVLNLKVVNLKFDVHHHYNNKINYLYSNYSYVNNELLFSKINDADLEKLFNNFNTKNNYNNANIIKQANLKLKNFIQEKLIVTGENKYEKN